MEQLKTLLGEQLYASLIEKLAGKELFMHEKGQKVLVDDGSLIPKHRLDEVVSQRDGFKTQAEQFDKDLKALKTAAKGNEELTAKIEELQTQNKTNKEKFDADQLQVRKSFAIKEALMNAGVGDVTARETLSKSFGDVELNQDGTVKRFDDLIKPFKENAAFKGMFGTVKLAGPEHKDGGTPIPLSELETKLLDAQKTGNTMQVVALKRQIAEENSKKAA